MQMADKTTELNTAPGTAEQSTVVSIMTSHPRFIRPSATLQECAVLMRDADCGALPVVEDIARPAPIGVVTDRDLVIRGLTEGESASRLHVADVMTADPEVVRHDASIDEAVRVLARNQVRRVLVVDDDGLCIGIVAQADLARDAPEHMQDVVQAVSEPEVGADAGSR
jgi:CBS domain-containing protein